MLVVRLLTSRPLRALCLAGRAAWSLVAPCTLWPCRSLDRWPIGPLACWLRRSLACRSRHLLVGRAAHMLAVLAALRSICLPAAPYTCLRVAPHAHFSRGRAVLMAGTALSACWHCQLSGLGIARCPNSRASSCWVPARFRSLLTLTSIVLSRDCAGHRFADLGHAGRVVVT